MQSKERLQEVIDLCSRGWEDERGEMQVCEALHALLPGAKPLGPYRYTQDMNAAQLFVPLLPDGCRVRYSIVEERLGEHTATVHTSASTASYAAFALVLASLRAALTSHA